AFSFVKGVLRDPRRVEAGLFRVTDLLGRQEISLRRWRDVEKPREEAHPPQICEMFHGPLRDRMMTLRVCAEIMSQSNRRKAREPPINTRSRLHRCAGRSRRLAHPYAGRW